MKRIAVLVVILSVGFGAVTLLSQRLSSIESEMEVSEAEELYLSAPQLRLAGHDMRGLLADWYWISCLQYLGDKLVKFKGDIDVNDLRALDAKLVYPMLDSATTLDPQFTNAYTFGALILPAINPRNAISLLEKGIADNPDEWRFYHNLGYIYWEQKNYEKAAELYTTGSQKPQAPDWMKQMSVNMAAFGGTRDFARSTYRQMFETAEDEQTRSFAELRYLQINALDQIDAVNKILQEEQKRTGNCPPALAAILPALKKVKMPAEAQFLNDKNGVLVDPSGVPYGFEPNQCRIYLGPTSKIPQRAL